MFAAHVLFQSDVLQVAEQMRDTFEASTGNLFKPDPEYHQLDCVFHASSATEGDIPSEESTSDSDPCGDGISESADSTTMVPSMEENLSTSTAQVQDSPVLPWASSGWLLDNPIMVPTEREIYVLEQGLKVYRTMLVRM